MKDIKMHRNERLDYLFKTYIKFPWWGLMYRTCVIILKIDYRL